MSTDAATRVLLLRDPHADTPAWQQLDERLPAADRAGDREVAARCLDGTRYNLIVTDAVLPDGGPYGLLGTLIARQYDTTVVVHFRLESGQRWLVLFADGEFDLQAEPMTTEQFFRWLDEWLASRPAPAATDAA
jgi:hypothetical protein